MKQSVRCLLLPGAALGFGVLGAILRSFYFKNALDGEGFFLRNQPMQILFWVLAAVMVIAGAVLSFKGKKSAGKAPMGIPAALTEVILGVILFLTGKTLDSTMSFSAVLRPAAYVCAAAFLADGILRGLKKKTGMGANGLFCLFLLIYSVGSYSVWRSIPEMERFITPALGLLLLLPLSCEMAAWDLGLGSRRRLVFLAGLTCFFSVSGLSCPGAPVLSLGAVVYSLSALWFLGREES